MDYTESGLGSSYTGLWEAYIPYSSKPAMGPFFTAEEAARAHDQAAEYLFADYACTNVDLGLLT